ncbi:MAG: flagellar assembly peptidoglycan hydrolase FlgJ, partial [Gammaproteobacteria bacterium]|nr:flagellar assembly peptidoglycan hydrolase FlgJ [Gammaproteobacteria bacterium]
QIANETQGAGLGDYLQNTLSVMKLRGQTTSEPEQNDMLAAITVTDLTHQANEPDAINWEKPEDFIDDLWPHAVKAGEELGVSPDVLIAQSALETGWGRYTRSFDNGQSSYNMFGIKADQRWQGNTIRVSTLEYKDGAMQREQAQFRAYSSVAEAFNDYVDFIQSHPRYEKALESNTDAQAYARELQQAGYATDPDYARKIEQIRNSDLLTRGS